MADAIDIDVADFSNTMMATTLALGQFEFPERSVALLDVAVIAVRDDMTTKAWSLQSLVRRTVGGSPTILENIPATPNLFATATDATTLSDVTISMFTDNVYIGVNCTGQAGQTIYWSVRIKGRKLFQ